MKLWRTSYRSLADGLSKSRIDRKLATYLAASASVAPLLVEEAEAVVVSNTTVQPFGINQHVDIDFNSDGQIDFQIDHDRVNVNGTDLDYLQIDKNDVSSAENPYPINPIASFPLNGTPRPNGDHYYITDAGPGDIGFYPKALLANTEIGPLSDGWEIFQETDGFGQNSNQIIRANRLIDEDAGQVDAANPNPPDGKTPVAPFGSPGWIGLGGQTRYLGIKIDLVDEIEIGLNDDHDEIPPQYLHGWIGVRITNEADATGEVVGWGYQTEPDVSIRAGETAPVLDGDYNSDGTVDAADYIVWRKSDGSQSGYNTWRQSFGESMTAAGAIVGSHAGAYAVPEPGSLLLGLMAGIAMVGAYIHRRIRGS